MESPFHLPNSAQFITSIIHQLSKFHPPAPPVDTNDDQPQPQHSSPNSVARNPLATLPAPLTSKVKPLLLTLHCLFPNELLLALDILDRKLIRRYDFHTPEPPETVEVHEEQQQNDSHVNGGGGEGVYLVRSSSTTYSSATSHNRAIEKDHVVCLNAWNCTCPAFTLSTFRDLNLNVDLDHPRSSENFYGEQEDDNYPFPFRGTLTKSLSTEGSLSSYGTPVCKHLLACLLSSQCTGLFGGGTEIIDGCEVEEIAGRFVAG
ncbi:hypothetical protein AJ79_03432 [Helicocarpus griseus UAMH5409]|uniref:SWIM-type domain-containing protein n=1 Tax=Helicocarpus griseus UAMH5409 TaxID=1447875 RepID=A0A2B7XY78_9EURO|nr:hypothetical protein AJ79_03432 [Helicocarpus griseus UAMH5409]